MADQVLDLRITVEFWDHRKTRRVERVCGVAGFRSLIVLFSKVRSSRPDGVLTGWTSDDVEEESDWGGEPGKFFNSLRDFGWLEVEDGVYRIHDWVENQPYASGSFERTMAATKANLQRQVKEGRISDSDAANRLKIKEKQLRKARAEGVPLASVELAESERTASEGRADSVPPSARVERSGRAAPEKGRRPTPHHTTPAPEATASGGDRGGAGGEEQPPPKAPSAQTRNGAAELPVGKQIGRRRPPGIEAPLIVTNLDDWKLTDAAREHLEAKRASFGLGPLNMALEAGKFVASERSKGAARASYRDLDAAFELWVLKSFNAPAPPKERGLAYLAPGEVD